MIPVLVKDPIFDIFHKKPTKQNNTQQVLLAGNYLHT